MSRRLAQRAPALAVDPSLVRSDRLAGPPHDGVAGDPRRATAEPGRVGPDQVVASSTAAVRARWQSPR
jgi:creatinine amidohydrolase/Fe(II)-dependent formamide hydrolase-like protein